MRPIFTAHISTLIVGLFRAFVQSGPSAVLSGSAPCGLKVTAHSTDGTAGFISRIDLSQPNLSPFKLAVALTPGGKLLILCACSQCDEARLSTPFGAPAGTCYTPVSSSAQPCGCDVGHVCAQHLADYASK